MTTATILGNVNRRSAWAQQNHSSSITQNYRLIRKQNSFIEAGHKSTGQIVYASRNQLTRGHSVGRGILERDNRQKFLSPASRQKSVTGINSISDQNLSQLKPTLNSSGRVELKNSRNSQFVGQQRSNNSKLSQQREGGIVAWSSTSSLLKSVDNELVGNSCYNGEKKNVEISKKEWVKYL